MKLNSILRTFACSLVILAPIAQAAEKICAPYFELINLSDEFRLSSIRVLKSKVEESPGRELVIPGSADTLTSAHPFGEQAAWAQAVGCSHLLQVSLTRLGETVQVSSKVTDLASNTSVYQRGFKASSPDDLFPVMGQIGLALNDPKFTHAESIYDVSRADARALTKKRSSVFYSAQVGYDAFDGANQFYRFGGSMLWDNRTFFGEAVVLFGVNANSADEGSMTNLSIMLYRPVSEVDHTFYWGGGMGFGGIVERTPTGETNFWGDREYDEVSRSGLLFTGAAGYMIGRTSDFRARLQGELNLIADQSGDNGMPLGAGFRLILDIGS